MVKNLQTSIQRAPFFLPKMIDERKFWEDVKALCHTEFDSIDYEEFCIRLAYTALKPFEKKNQKDFRSIYLKGQLGPRDQIT